jgi:hypothetical protein
MLAKRKLRAELERLQAAPTDATAQAKTQGGGV